MMFIDSNYWIYLFDKSTVEHEYVKGHFDEIYGDVPIAVSSVILVEVMHYLVKRLGPILSREKWDVFRAIDMLIGNLDVDYMDSVFEQLTRHAHVGIGGRDATVLQFMEDNGIKTICTHDGAFKKVEGITVVDPVPSKGLPSIEP